jgi:hypothetical protein
MESKAVWNLKPEPWGSLMVREKYWEEEARDKIRRRRRQQQQHDDDDDDDDDDDNNNNNICKEIGVQLDKSTGTNMYQNP